ncbi:hypothetical protein LEP1GSC133_2933 [Leptospira borgpetersenii serovar Pomona str. 200901868]|uniref:Uncharacterized protein n=1 Tax=Leptospira borgpetersenii serovar Pomona str. 200901868 TaxID=1192866 RepID=M6W4L1_LEPBO|nr:hypothetical protein LEP1GSC133_2933 [Leptospira borgpetersenii serovar Pomona str. 200901868]
MSSSLEPHRTLMLDRQKKLPSSGNKSISNIHLLKSNDFKNRSK